MDQPALPSSAHDPSHLVERHAECLVDEVFAEVEELLGAGDYSPPPPPPPRVASPRQTLGLVALGAAGALVLGGTGFWAALQLLRPPALSEVPAAPPIPRPDPFFAYLAHSLNQLEAREHPDQPSPGPLKLAVRPLPVPSSEPLPTVAIPSPPPPLVNNDQLPTTPGQLTVPLSTPAPPLTTYTLTGVLNLGDQSAALFNIGGTTQQVYIGQDVGPSAWKLTQVQTQAVVIRRQQKTLTLFVGQDFQP